MTQSKKKIRRIRNWQKHTLSATVEELRKHAPECELDEGLIFTGTVVSDSSGRFAEGWHCRTTLALKFNGTVVETRNTIYLLVGEGNSDTMGDMGDNVMSIFY